MKRFIASLLLALFATGCWPAPEEQEKRNNIVERSIRCMFGGECS